MTGQSIFTVPFLSVLIGFCLGAAGYCGVSSYLYHKTDYAGITHKPWLSVMLDKGAHGEYLTYKYLRAYEKDGARFLFNCYLPRENDETTEIDVLMIHSSGIYVFESKNYSGWIFGSENQKNWTQTLPSGRTSTKEHFLNPIMQNKLHIKWLINRIGNEDAVHSIIVFSERCTLKKVEVTSPDIFVVKRDEVKRTVDKIAGGTGRILDAEETKKIYDTLYPFTQVSEELKEQHIQDIRESHESVEPQAVSVLAEDIGGNEKTIDGKRQSADDKDSSDEKITVDRETCEAGPKSAEGQRTDNVKATGEMICPRCGGALTIRVSTRGKYAGNRFYGCTNFPKCRYTAAIDEKKTANNG